MVRGRGSRKVQEREKTPVSTSVPAELLNVPGAARWLGVGRSTFFALMQEDGFPIIRLTERCIRFANTIGHVKKTRKSQLQSRCAPRQNHNLARSHQSHGTRLRHSQEMLRT